MSYYGWQSFYRNASRWIGDTSGAVGRWYDQNKQYLPNNVTAARSMGFGTHGTGFRNLINWGQEQFNRAWENSHGADRYWLSQIPGYGWGKQMQGQADYYEDYYKHTGVDPKYPQTYSRSSGGLLGSVNSEVGGSSPARWARSLEQMFPVKYEENLSRTEAFNKGYW